MATVSYLFRPKSTKSLVSGQFCVIQLHPPGPGALRAFLCGLMNWTGNTPPTSEAIAGHRVIEQGNAHLKSIWKTGGELLGWRSLDEDSIGPGLFLSHSGGPGVRLMKGYEILRPATSAEIA